MEWKRLLLFISFAIFKSAITKNPLPVELVFKWRYAELLDPPRSSNIGGHPNYIPKNNVIYGVSHDVQNDVIYASIPRGAPGVAATLVYLANTSEFHPKFVPFPDNKFNELKGCDLHPKTHRKGGNRYRSSPKLDYSFDHRYDSAKPVKLRFPQCNSNSRLISTYEPVLDHCHRLWVLDTGVLEYNSGNVIVKRPQLWTFDVKNGPARAKLIRRFDFPSTVIQDGTGLTGLAVDVVNRNCEETFVYIPNQIDERIVVYDFYKDISWFFENFSFRGDSAESDFNHEGYDSYYKAGVSTITLGPEERGSGHFRTIYYTAGSSTGEYSVSTRELRFPENGPLIKDVTLVGYRGKDSQAMVHVFDEPSGVLFFAESQTGRVRCWNSRKPLRPENLVTVFESKHFIYGSYISIDALGNLWFLSNRYPLFKGDVYDYSKYNIRVYKSRVRDIISGTACEKPKKQFFELTKENIQKLFNINITEVITDDLLKK